MHRVGFPEFPRKSIAVEGIGLQLMNVIVRKEGESICVLGRGLRFMYAVGHEFAIDAMDAGI